MRESPDPRFVTVAQAAAMLGVSRQRVHQLIEQGYLGSMRRYRHVYVPREDVERRLAMRVAETQLMTTADVGRHLGKTVKQVHKIVENGALTPLRTDAGRLLFDPAHVAAYRPRPAHRPRKEQP